MAVAKLTSECTEPVLIITPPPVLRMTGMPYLAARKIAFRPMFKVPSQSFSSSSVAEPWRNHIALLWTMSTRPKASSVRANISMTSADSPTSVRTKMASPPSALILSTTRWPPSALTSATQTDAPSRARTCAVTSPIPEAAPVTMAALPAIRPLLLIVGLLFQKLDMLSVNILFM